MNHKKDLVNELEYRIKNEIEHYDGKMTEPSIMAWHGYLGALLEWSVISVQEYDKVTDLIPSNEIVSGGEDAMLGIFIGRK